MFKNLILFNLVYQAFLSEFEFIRNTEEGTYYLGRDVFLSLENL